HHELASFVGGIERVSPHVRHPDRCERHRRHALQQTASIHDGPSRSATGTSMRLLRAFARPRDVHVEPTTIRKDRIEEGGTFRPVLERMSRECYLVACLERRLVPTLAAHDVGARSLDVPCADALGVDTGTGINLDDDVRMRVDPSVFDDSPFVVDGLVHREDGVRVMREGRRRGGGAGEHGQGEATTRNFHDASSCKSGSECKPRAKPHLGDRPPLTKLRSRERRYRVARRGSTTSVYANGVVFYRFTDRAIRSVYDTSLR